MGSDRWTRSKVVARCCHGALFGFGFVFTIFALLAMFWIAWCYFGLAIIQTSESQRRAAVDWSNGSSSKSLIATPTTASPIRSTVAGGENSGNSISKYPTTENVLRGSSGRAVASTVPSPRGPPKSKEVPVEAAPILTAPEDSEEDGVYTRRVSSNGPENRPEDKISPTKVYQTVTSSGESSRVGSPASETRSSDRDEIQSSRRSDPTPVYRDPDFDREYSPRQSTTYIRGDSRYDDSEDDRGSRSRYDKRDRGRQSDDYLSKGDARVYPDDREKYPDDDTSRKGDDDRRDYDSRPRYRDRDSEDRSRPRDDDRYRDDRDEPRYRSRDDDRYRPRDDDRYVPRDDDRYRYRDEDDRYRRRDDDRYRYRDDDDRYRTRTDDRYRYRDEERYRDDERYRTRDDDRYRDVSRVRDADVRDSASRIPEDDRKLSSSRSYETRRDDYDRSRTQARGDGYSERDRDDDYRRPSRDDDYRRPSRDDDYRKPSRYDDEERKIAPTRTRVDYSLSESSIIDTRSRESTGNSRLIVDDRLKDSYYDREDRTRDTRLQGSRNASPVSGSSRRYTDDDERYRTRLPNERYDSPKGKEEVILDRRSYASEESDEYRRGNSRFDDAYEDRTRRPVDETRRPIDETRRPIDEPRRPIDEPRKFVDEPRRPIDEPRKFVDETRRPIDESRRPVDEPRRSVDEPRRPISESRRYKDDETISRRDPVEDDDYKRSRGRDDYERDRNRNRDRYDRPYDDRYLSRDERLPPLPMRKYDTYDDDRSSRRDAPYYKESSRGREEPSPSYIRDDSTDSKSRRRYDDDLAPPGGVSSDNDRYSKGSPSATRGVREPTDVVIREKRFQTSEAASKRQNVRLSGDEGDGRLEAESRPSLSPKEVIEAAIRHSDTDPNARKVYYPVFDPRVSNLTSPEIIRPGERRGTTITAKK